MYRSSSPIINQSGMNNQRMMPGMNNPQNYNYPPGSNYGGMGQNVPGYPNMYPYPSYMGNEQ